MPLRGHHSPPTRLAVVSRGVASGKAPERILYFAEGDPEFLLLDADVPEDPDETQEGDLLPVCLPCLIDQHPEAGAGMDIAIRAGTSRFVEGRGWMEERQ